MVFNSMARDGIVQLSPVHTSVFFDAREQVGFVGSVVGMAVRGEMEHFLRAVLANIFFEQRKEW